MSMSGGNSVIVCRVIADVIVVDPALASCSRVAMGKHDGLYDVFFSSKTYFVLPPLSSSFSRRRP